MTYLTDQELIEGAATAESAWGVGEYEAQLHNMTEPRVACNEPEAPDPPQSAATGEEGLVPIIVHRPRPTCTTPRRAAR